MQNQLPNSEIVLLGVGHTNAHVLKMWRMSPLPKTRLTCVSNFGTATYSGMLPGTLAGQYEPEEMKIDLVRLCAAAGARLIQAEVSGLDPERRQLLFAERPPLPFDALSIGVGSRPAKVPGEDVHVLQIKPMQLFLSRLKTRLDILSRQVAERPWRIAIVGGGAAGFEIACCLHRYLQQNHPQAQADLTLLDRSSEILKRMPSRTRSLAKRELNRQRVELVLDHEVLSIDGEGRMLFADGSQREADLILWAASARAPEILDRFDLPKDEQGFLLTRNTLQSTATDSIFAVGDSGSLEKHPTPKAGVYAVRQGPPLWENLKRHLLGQPLIEWQPQRSFLTLMNTGNDRAILTYKGLSVHARWCWKLKDRIDRGFMAMFQDDRPAMAKPPIRAEASTMHCGGCGCKLPADVLSRVLSQLDNPQTPHVLLGLDHPDDVAVLKSSAAQLTAVTTDFFTAFLDDPHLLGQVAAQNALSDLYASGAKPHAALAMVIVPHGPVRPQEQFLVEVLEGALRVLRPAEVPIVGGHTIEGEQATVGFTLLGDLPKDNFEQQFASKGGLQVGDQLVLTKPLGTGMLLVGQQQAMCRADWREPLIASMLASNRNAGAAARDLGIQAITDVTGFGLAGHLWEMVLSSQVSAQLSLSDLPLLPGVLELADQGIESTLAPGNRQVERHLNAPKELRRAGRYATLFDPQTSGGLLLGVPEDSLESLLERLRGAGTVIGKIVEQDEAKPRITVLR